MSPSPSSSSSSLRKLFMNEIQDISKPYTNPILTSQDPNTVSSQTHDIELGRKTLTVCPENDQKHHNSCIMTSNLLSPPASPASFSHMGDYIGTESCVDLKNYEDVNMGGGGELNGVTDMVYQSCHRRRRNERWAMKKKEFPPPISLLARTENLPSHMPFVLKRYYTNDGRLILREVKVRHHEYFRAHRSNGHLTLQLVPLDDDNDDDDDDDDPFDEKSENYEQQCNDEQEAAETVAEAEADTENKDGFTYINNKVEEEEEILHGNVERLIAETYKTHQLPESPIENNERTVNGGPVVCLNYNNVIMSSSCFLGLPVPANT